MTSLNEHKIDSRFFSLMYTIRTVETLFLDYYTRGFIKGTVHTCLGQEATAVGVMSAIDQSKDVVFSSHRAHGHFIAYGGPIRGLIAEVLGLEEGICGGIGGTQHLHWKNFYTSGIQGGIVPLAVGSALAEKRKGTGAIVVVFLGDGTMGQGVVYESFNLAALWQLPVIFVLEDNKYAQTTPKHIAHAGLLEHRANPFGIRTILANGNDVRSVFDVATSLVAEVRKKSLPAFLVLDTYRLGPHSKGDDLRSEEELEQWRKKDPIDKIAQEIPLQESDAIKKRVRNDIEGLFKALMNN